MVGADFASKCLLALYKAAARYPQFCLLLSVRLSRFGQWNHDDMNDQKKENDCDDAMMMLPVV
jgi:hypothetical protein